MGTSNIGESKDKVAKTELDMVQHALLQQYAKYTVTKNKEDIQKGIQIKQEELMTLDTTWKQIGITILNKGTYYRLDDTNSDQIGLKQIKYSYVVNYETGEVINDSVRTTTTGEPLYTKGVNN